MFRNHNRINITVFIYAILLISTPKLIFAQDDQDVIINTNGSSGDNSYGSYNTNSATATNYSDIGGIVVKILNGANFTNGNDYTLEMRIGNAGALNSVEGTPRSNGKFNVQDGELENADNASYFTISHAQLVSTTGWPTSSADLENNTITFVITDTDDDPEDQFYSITYDLDLIVPTISNILITSDNDYNGTDNGSFTASTDNPYYATTDNRISVTYTASEALLTPTGTLAGVAQGLWQISSTDDNKIAWTVSTVIGETHTEGTVTFAISVVDEEGNDISDIASTSDNIVCIVDKTAPTLTMTVVETGGSVHPGTDATPTYYAADGSEIVISIVSNENLLQDVNNHLKLDIDGVYTNMAELEPTNSSQRNYSATKVLDADDLGASSAEGDQLTITLTQVRDLAGNQLTTNGADGINATTNGSRIIFDTVAPTINSITMATDGEPGYATIDDVLTLTLGVSVGKIWAPTVQFAGDNDTYSNATTVAGTNLDWTAGDADAQWTATLTVSAAIGESIVNGTKFKLNYEDYAGNTGAEVTNLTSNNTNRPKIDYTAPTLGAAIGIVSNGTGTLGGTMYAKSGNSVTLSVQGGENLKVADGLFDVTIGGSAATPAQVDADQWTASIASMSSEAEGVLVISFKLRDMAGNESAAFDNTGITDGSSVIFDKTAPSVSNFTFASNNAYTTAGAKDGDRVTLTFDSNDDQLITGGDETVGRTITIAQTAATITRTDRSYVAFVDMDKDNANQIEGNIPISITMTDKAGNVANEVTQANVVLEDATLTVTYDKTIPALTAVTYENITGTAPNPQTHATTDDQIRLSIVANDDLYYHATDNGGPWPKIKISKRSTVLNDVSLTTLSQTTASQYLGTYTMTANDDEGNIEFEVTFRDEVGNAGAAVVTDLLDDAQGTIEFDKTVPAIVSLSYVSNNENSVVLAKQGNEITVTVQTNDEIEIPIVSVSGHASDGTTNTTLGNVNVSKTNDQNWTAKYIMTGGDAATDAIALGVTFMDQAGNQGTPADQTFAGVTAIAYDPVTPTLETVTFQSNNTNTAYAKVGDEVTVTISTDEALAANPNFSLFTVDDIELLNTDGGTMKAFARTIEITNAMGEGTIDNTNTSADNFKVTGYSDEAGNTGADRLTPTDDSSILLDKTPPVSNSVTFSHDGTDYDATDDYTYLKLGGSVTVIIDPNEEIQQPSLQLFKQSGAYETSDATNSAGDFTVVDVVESDNWQMSKVFNGDHDEGEIEFSLTFDDLVGNSLATTVTAIDGGATKIWYDKTAPSVQSITSWGSNNTDCGEADCSEFAIPGNTVTLEFTTLENVQTPTIKIGEQNITPTQKIVGNHTRWVATRIMDGSESINNGANNTENNAIPFTIALMDFADIPSADAFSDTAGRGDFSFAGDAITFDNTGPSLESTDITSDNDVTSNNKYAQEGDVVTIEIEVGERVKASTIAATVAGVSDASADANKPSISLGVDGNGNAEQKITITKVMSSSDSEGYIPFSVTFSNINGFPYDNGGSVTENNLTGNSVLYDKTNPTIESFTIACDGEQEDPSGNKYATNGNTITVTLQTNEDINKPNIHIAGNDTLTGGVVVAQGSNKKNWTATYNMRIGDDDTDAIEVDIIELRDLAYNLADNLASKSPTPNIIYDKTAPTFSNVTIISPTNNNASSGLGVTAGERAKVGDNILITFTVAEARGIVTPVVTLEALNNAVINSDNAPIYTATFTSIPDFGDAGPLTFNIQATDYAGNANNFAHTDLVGDNVVFDGEQPVISIVEAELTIQSDGGTATYAKVGDDVTLTFKITDNNDQIHDPTVRIAGNMCTNDNGGNSVTPTYNDLNTSGSWDSGDTWTVTYTMQESDEDVSTTGCTNIRFQIDVTDLAGNIGTAVTHSDVVTNVIFDRTAPQLAGETSALKIWTDAGNSSSHAKSADEVKVQVKFNEATAKPTIAIASKAATVADSDDGGFTWTGAYTFFAANDNETGVASTISVQYDDLAGNSGTEATETTDGSFVIFDKTVPTIDCDSCLTISSNNIWDNGYDENHPKTANTYAIAGNEVYIFVKADNNEVLAYPPDIEFKTSSSPDDFTQYTAITPQVPNNWYRATYTMQQGDLEGDIDFKVTIKDLAGNALENVTNSSITDGSKIEYDTQAPDVTGIEIDLKLDYDSGISNADDVTNIAKPRFTISGLTPDSGDSAIVVVNGDLTNNTNCIADAGVPCREYAKVVGAGISNFGFLADVVEMHTALTSNNINGQDHTFQVYLRDPAGNLSNPSNALTVTYDGDVWTHPTGAKTNLMANFDSGFDNSDNYTNITSDLKFEIEKQYLPPDELAQMKLITNAWDTTNIKILNAPGVSTTLKTMNALNTNQEHTLESPLSQGWNAVRFTITDRAGNESDTSDKELVFIDIAGPGTPSNLNLDPSTDTGVSTTDNLTNSNTSLSFTIDDVRETDFLSVYYKDANGDTIQVGTEVLVPNNINGSTLDDTKNYTGSFSFTLSGLNLSDSTYQMFLISKDGFGNLSNATVSTLDITIDTTPSSVAGVTIDLVDDDDTGKLNSDNLTSNRAPRFDVANLTVGDQAYLYLNGVIRDTVEVTDATSTIFTPDSLDNSDATYIVTVKQRDDAGNLSAATTSNGGNFTLDVTAPAIASDAMTDLNDIEADDSGYSQTDNYTNVTKDLTFNLQQAFLPPLENAFIKLYYWSVTAKDEATAGDGTVTTTEKIMTGWNDHSMDLDDDLSQGWYAIKFTLTDSAGNETSKTSAEYIFIDIVEPTKLSGLDLDLTTDSGVSDSDNLTNSSTILTFNVSGTRETDYVRLFYTNNQGNPVFIGEKQVTIDGGLGTPHNPVSNPNIFNFSLTGLSLVDSSYVIYAVARDYMGNNSSQTDDNLTITIDTTPSDVSAVNIDLDDISDTGKSEDDYLTNDVTPQFTVTKLASNDSVYLYISGDTKLASAEVGADSIITFTSDSITGGALVSKNATIKLEDDAGNISVASSALAFNLDTELPNSATFQKPQIVSEDNTCIYAICDPPNTSNMAPRFFLDGLTTNLDSIRLMIRGIDPVVVEEVVTETRMLQASSETVAVGGSGIPAAGKYAVYYYLVDDAGNYSLSSPEQNVVFDNIKPTAPQGPDLINTDIPKYISDTGRDSVDNITNQLSTIFKVEYNSVSASQRGVLDKITHAEPWDDAPGFNGIPEVGEYQDLNENGVYDAESIDRVSGFTETPNTLIPSDNDGIIVFNLDNQYYTSDSNSVSYVSIAIDSAGNETASSDTLMVIYDQRKPELVKYLLPDHPDSTIWIGDGSLRFDFLFSEKLTNKIDNYHELDPDYPNILPWIEIEFPGDVNDSKKIVADLESTTIFPGDTIGREDQTFKYDLILREDLNSLNINNPAGEALNIYLRGMDIAGNKLEAPFNSIRQQVILDIINPTFANNGDNIKPNHNSFINDAALDSFQWNLNELLDSGLVEFDNLGDDFIENIAISLDSEERNSPGPTGYDSLNNWSSNPLINNGDPTQLVDQAIYNIIFTGIDIAGNTGKDTVRNVKYDITKPTALLSYSNLNGEPRPFASNGDTVTIKAEFSEPMSLRPLLKLTWADATTDSFDMEMVPNSDSSDWVYDVTMPEGIEKQGRVHFYIKAEDLAYNIMDTTGLNEKDLNEDGLADSLFLDNTDLFVGLSYENITQPLIQVEYPNEIVELTNVAKGGDSIRVTAVLTDSVIFDNSDIPNPKLMIVYGSKSDTSLGITQQYEYTSRNPNRDTLTFDFKLSTGISNDGLLAVKLIAQDRAGNAVVGYTNKTDSLFRVDNIPPAAFEMKPILFADVAPTQFTTYEALVQDFYTDLDNDPLRTWYNNIFTHVYTDIYLPPYEGTGSDSTMRGGKVEFKVKKIGEDLETTDDNGNLVFKPEVTVGNIYLLDPTSDFGWNIFNMDSAALNVILKSQLDLGDSLIILSYQTDIHGNTTVGTIGEGEIHKFRFDNEPMTASDTWFLGGNIFGVDQIYSTDKISVRWDSFTDNEPGGGSGFWKYLFRLVHHPNQGLTQMKGYMAHQEGDTDPDTVLWENWAELSYDNPDRTIDLLFNSADVDTLYHDNYYEFQLFSEDLAGNKSDTVSCTATRDGNGYFKKFNSAPEISSIPAVTMYEDTLYTEFQTISITDLDFSTFQGDSISYTVQGFKDVDNIGVDPPTVPYTEHLIDIADSLLSWDPKQSDVGIYTVRVVAEDLSQLSQTVYFPLEVIAVNDAPEIIFVNEIGYDTKPDSILAVQWEEDDQGDTLHLTDYIIDVDNDIYTEIDWKFSFNKENLIPSQNQILGPPTPKRLARNHLNLIHKPANNEDIGVGPDILEVVNKVTNSDLINVSFDTVENKVVARFDSDSNFFGQSLLWFKATDPYVPFDVNSEKYDIDSVLLVVKDVNDPPVVTSFNDTIILENDSLFFPVESLFTDVDDDSLKIKISALTNPTKITVLPDSIFNSIDLLGANFPKKNGISGVFIKPQRLWSEDAQINMAVIDSSNDTTSSFFLLDIDRVSRPALSISIIHNNAFANYLDIFIIDTLEKTVDLSAKVQSEALSINNIAPHVWSSKYDFSINKNYELEITAQGEVGDTLWKSFFSLANASSASRWTGISGDGNFIISGEPGSVISDRSLIITDSSLFNKRLDIHASYLVGHESFVFQKPVRVSFNRDSKDLAIYTRLNGSVWTELPSISTDGQIISYSTNAGYYRLGQKTLIVPELTAIHQNYPNPFNPVTNIKYDIGLLDGLEQNVTIEVYNVMGQYVQTLVKNRDQIGQFTVQWNGQNSTGQNMPTGIYFIRLSTSSGLVKNSKMMLLK